MVKSILIVDDCSLNQQLVGELFKRSMCVNKWSITLTCASCLADAKIYLQKYQFDIITLDGQMGFERGYDLIPFIKESQIQSPKIIMISNHDRSIAIGLEYGASQSIVKDDITKNVRINTEFLLIPMT